jgi:hypothetical protein
VANQIDRLSVSGQEMPHLPYPQRCQLDGEPHGRRWHHGRELTASWRFEDVRSRRDRSEAEHYRRVLLGDSAHQFAGSARVGPDRRPAIIGPGASAIEPAVEDSPGRATRRRFRIPVVAGWLWPASGGTTGLSEECETVDLAQRLRARTSITACSCKRAKPALR